MASAFYGPINAHIAIPAPRCESGGTMNFNFGSVQVDGPKREIIPFTTVPFAPDPDYVDRPEVIAWVRDKCAGLGARAALVGLGGVGKSQLAIRYAHSICDATPQTFVFWVHASTQARFEGAYRGIADRLELPGRNDPKANVLQMVSEWLCDETNGRWTMVVDSVDDAGTFFLPQTCQQDKVHVDPQIPLATYLPQSRNGSILITSRSKDAAARLVGGYNRIKEVLAMDEDQGLQLLQNKLQNPPIEGSALELLRALDCIPLAITQAAAYINRRGRMTIAGYLDEFRKNDKKREALLYWDAGELRRDGSASNSVVITWHMSFDRIRQERPSAANLLSLMSFFNPQGIPEPTLRRHARAAVGTGRLGSEDEADSAFDEDLVILQTYSLVAATSNSEVCEMHALVQFCTQVWLSSSGDAKQWMHMFVALMAQELPTGEYMNWAKCQQLLPHIEKLYNDQPAANEALEAWAQVLTNAAWYLWVTGVYSTAQELAAKALAAREKVPGLDYRQILTTVEVLALVLQYQGRYKDAETLHRRALERWDKKLGVLHLSTLVSNLALVLQYQGKFEDAEAFNRQALEGYKEGLGVDHPDTLTSMSNLAGVMQQRGKYKDAEMLNQQVLEGREKVLGASHPSTLTSVSNLALVLQYQSKYEDAEALSQRALEGRDKKLGARHPDTLTSVNNLALVLQRQGKFGNAELLYQRALEGYKKELGPHHPSTLTSMSNLALVLQYQGKYEDAETLSRQALEGRERELGPHHPDTLMSVHNLALVLQCQGRYEEAETLNRRALNGSEKELGPHHPDTLTSVYCLAHLLHRVSRYAEAAELCQRAYDGYEQQLGPQHPTTVACRSDLLGLQQEAEQARPVQIKALSSTNRERLEAGARRGGKASLFTRMKGRIGRRES